ncbi:LexA family transcriptional regulator [Brevibacillus laterosporus]|uniref:LexA family transcriptional regulator n=1 Tax=Brevibacillus laterosporus TaxID=1465 RepID=UPI001EF2256A|nr:LexA family transcriptional regulator [Brevibacillus laterosporus]MCG7317908.1 LexA family transcriptional regulator [Brevibacillus laterosporus]
MNYYNTLADLIKNSGLTLKEISEKCRQLGVKIDPSYISKLQSKKQPPASEEINKALAEVCGGDIDNIVFLGHLERNPEYIRLFIERTIEQFKESTKFLLTRNLTEDKMSAAIQYIDELPPVTFINQIAQQEPHKLNEEENEVIKNLAKKLTEFRMADKSMEPRIPINAILDIKQDIEIENGDYILVEIEDNQDIVRRYISVEDKVVLISENPNFKPIIVERKNLKVRGKVISYTSKIDL